MFIFPPTPVSRPGWAKLGRENSYIWREFERKEWIEYLEIPQNLNWATGFCNTLWKGYGAAPDHVVPTASDPLEDHEIFLITWSVMKRNSVNKWHFTLIQGFDPFCQDLAMQPTLKELKNSRNSCQLRLQLRTVLSTVLSILSKILRIPVNRDYSCQM